MIVRDLDSEIAVPINIAVVLALCRKLLVQLDTDESGRLSSYSADEAHSAVHVSWHIDHIADVQRAIGGGSRGHGAAVQCL